MASGKNRSKKPPPLRVRAEAMLAARNDEAPENSMEDAQLLHELQTHQIELEMQNEELRTAQLRLAEARDQYADLYDFAPVGYVTIDVRGFILQTNLTFAATLQVARRSLIKKPFSSLLDAESQDGYYLHLRDLRTSKQARSVELQIRLKSGAKRWVRLDSVVKRAPGEEPVFRSTVSDITERKRATEERRRLEQQVQQAQKLESLGVLAGGIAHDFNNLMATVLMRAELASLALPRGSPIGEHLEEIEMVAERASELATQMLNFAGRGSSEAGPVNLAELVEQTIPMVAAASSKKIKTEHRYSKALPSIHADTSQVGQIILNLITNAADSIGDQAGVITLTTDIKTCEPEFLARCVFAGAQSAGDYVYLEVSDTGVGMSSEVQSKMFDPFFSTKSQGRGLGLAAVLGIVRSHAGALRLHSAPGQGTTVQVFFPISSGPPGEAQIGSSQGPRVRKQETLSGTILVVEDEVALLMVLEACLERAGLRILTAADGLEGVTVFCAHSEEIDLVLIDRSMPGLSGEEALSQMRRSRSSFPAILMSGFVPESAPCADIPGEPIEFLHKPFRLEDLQKLIRNLLVQSASRS